MERRGTRATQPAVGEPGSRQMDKDGAAPAGNARPPIVVDLDDHVVEAIVAPEPVAGLPGGAPERPVVTPVRRVFAPGNRGIDAKNREPRRRAGAAIRPPPQPPQAKAAARRCAVALALVRPDAGAAKDDRDRERAGEQEAAATRARTRARAGARGQGGALQYASIELHHGSRAASDSSPRIAR